MKKFSYLIVCIVFMFGFYDNVFAKICGSTPRCDSADRRDAGAPVANYVNTCGNDNGQNGSCNVSNNASISSEKIDIIYIDPDNGNKFNPCYYECYKKRKVLIMIDDSNSMGRAKIEKTKDAIESIADAMTLEGDQLRVCYFSGECIKVGNTNWISPDQVDKIVDDIDRKHENTNFVSAYDRVENIFSSLNGNHIPVLFFITDGYPTANNSGALGYLSSARYAYQAANRLENLVSAMKNATYSPNNIYTSANARVVTVGVGINTDDNYAKFILNPTTANRDSLASSGNSEEVTLRSMLFNKGSAQYEAVAGICSFPDKGGVVRGTVQNATPITSTDSNGNTIITGYKQRVDFVSKDGGLKRYLNEDKLYYNNSNYPNSGGLCFTVGSNVDLTLRCRTANGYKCDGSKETGFSDVPKDSYKVFTTNFGIKFVRLSASFFEKRSNATYRLLWTTGASQSTNGSGANTYSNSANIKYNGVFASYLGANAITKLQNALKSSPETNPLYFKASEDKSFFLEQDYKEVTHNNCTGVNGSNTVQVKPENDVFVINGTSYNSISVPVVITEDAKFDAGNLDENFSVNAGRGFIINNAYVENTIRWYYSYFDDYNNNIPSDPIVYYGSDSKTSLSSLRKANGRSYSNEELDQLVWNAIKSTKLETNEAKERVKDALTTVDSNNVDKISTVPLEVTVSEGSNCATVYNSDRSSGNKSCTIKYTISQPKGCFKTNDQNEREFAYGSNCNGNYNYNVDKPNQYFIPFAHKIGELPINITGNFSSVMGLDLDFNTSCKITVGQGTFKGYPDKLAYRTIDVENPFPKSNNELSKIAVNWREWYCSNSDNSSGNCAIDNQNKMRLANSYNSSRLLYSVNLNDSVIDYIVSDTSSGNYYYSFGTINNSGSSNFVNNRIISNLFSIHNATNSYCELGEFSESCDQYQ